MIHSNGSAVTYFPKCSQCGVRITHTRCLRSPSIAALGALGGYSNLSSSPNHADWKTLVNALCSPAPRALTRRPLFHNIRVRTSVGLDLCAQRTSRCFPGFSTIVSRARMSIMASSVDFFPYTNAKRYTNGRFHRADSQEAPRSRGCCLLRDRGIQ